MKLDLSAFNYLRLGVATPELRLADPTFNVERIRSLALRAADAGCRLLVSPELAVTGYSCGDLFLQGTLLNRAESAIGELAVATETLPLALVVGAPLRQGGRLFNCAVVLAGGTICGVVPKSFIPNSQEFYERRWFSPADAATSETLSLCGAEIPFGVDLLFQLGSIADCRFGIELCEDLWTPVPPSGTMALGGATIIANLSASPETLGKADYRRDLVRMQSARCLAAYAYAGAGPGESSSDLVFSGGALIAENGVILAEGERFAFESRLILADIDIERLRHERLRNSSFASAPLPGGRLVTIPLGSSFITEELLRPLDKTPFVPAARTERSSRCREIFAIQTTGLARRLRQTGGSVVLGLSGGLDSTLALLVAVKAFDRLNLDRSRIVAVTMPGFGTTERTRGNAEALAAKLGVTLRTIPIAAAVRQHFADIGHDESIHDVTYENAQARERTQILMDVANQSGGIVLGTGDLSELALGWCTYNGDHMSMYGVNAGVPKTLVRYLVEWCADEEFSGATSTTLRDIAATPVSPELLPPTPDGEIAQITEETVGPYRLHDFFLYHFLRWQTPPAKIELLARLTFGDEFRSEEIRKWLAVFIRRFFSQQFKRNCLPDGPKVGSVALSPRGDWRMPSDASPQLWLEELERS